MKYRSLKRDGEVSETYKKGLLRKEEKERDPTNRSVETQRELVGALSPVAQRQRRSDAGL